MKRTPLNRLPDFEVLSVADLIALRKEAGLKMLDVARVLGIHPDTYSALEKSDKLPAVYSMALTLFFQTLNEQIYNIDDISLLEFTEKVKGYRPDRTVMRMLFLIESELKHGKKRLDI